MATVERHEASFNATSVTVRSDPAAPIEVGAGRSGSRFVNGYSGEVLGEGATGFREFFAAGCLRRCSSAAARTS